MNINIFSIPILILLFVWIVQGFGIAISQKSFSWKSGINLIASGCLVIGATGFFGSAMVGGGDLNLPESFEWPIGRASGVFRQPDGRLVVPHRPTGRIQIYDEHLEFQKGWFIQGHGGTFKLSPAEKDSFYIYTARGNRKYLYDMNGTLLSSEEYPAGEYSKIQEANHSVKIPTPFYLMVFIHPFGSWFVAVIGILLLTLTGEARRLSKKR